MYSGQLENVQLPIGTFGCLTVATGVASLRARSSVPSIPHPLRSELASASEPARPTKRRRVSATLNHERVLRPPRELDLAADGEALGAVGVLGEDVELFAARRLDHVLDRDPEEGGDDDLAAQDVRPVGRGLARAHE